MPTQSLPARPRTMPAAVRRSAPAWMALVVAFVALAGMPSDEHRVDETEPATAQGCRLECAPSGPPPDHVELPNRLPLVSSANAGTGNGLSIQVLHVIPAGTTPRFADMEQRIPHTIYAVQRFLKADVGRVLNFREGVTTVTVNDGASTSIAAQLRSQGYNRANTIYLSFVEGGDIEANPCGQRIDSHALLLMPRCDIYPTEGPQAWPFGATYLVLHELLHTLGAVPSCAPSFDGSGHASDSNRDVLGSVFPRDWSNLTVDAGRDDYLQHGRSGCVDIGASSAWIAGDDIPALGCVINGTRITTSIEQRECDALVALAESAGAEQWTDRTGWDSLETTTPADPCTYHGVFCTEGVVRHLDLNDNGLAGTIPAEIGNLVGLITLGLWNNELTGPLPPELGNLTELTGLWLNNNRITGRIPAEMSGMVSLESLVLWSNELWGEIPRGLRSLTLLTNVSLGDGPGGNRCFVAADAALEAWLDGLDPQWNDDAADPTCQSFCGSAGFRDVGAGSYFEAAVGWAFCSAITTGTTSTTFGPSQPVTRAQWATFLWRLEGRPTGNSHTFADVPAGSYFDEAVGWMAARGITTGTSPTTFSPNAPVTRAQVATFLWRYAGEPTSAGHPFDDVVPASFYEQAVAWMAAANITTGTTPTTFGPRLRLNRAQAVTFLWRYAAPAP